MLSDTQRSTLAARLRQGRESVAGDPRRGPRAAELPLSFGQEQLWFIDRFAPGRCRLQHRRLAAAARATGCRRAGPRARRAGGPARGAAHPAGGRRRRPPGAGDRPARAVPLAVDDLSGRWRSRPRGAAARAGRAGRCRRSAWPRGRCCAPGWSGWRRREHVAGDRGPPRGVRRLVGGCWSPSWPRCTRPRSAGEPSGLAELPVQFADYALWERERLHGAALAEAGGATGGRAGRVRDRRSSPPTGRGRCWHSFDGGIERLDDRPGRPRRAAGAEPPAGHHAVRHPAGRPPGAAAPLHRAGRHGRRHRERQPQPARAGPADRLTWSTPLPMRADLSGDPPFTGAAGRVRAATSGAYAHQDLPFARLVEALRVERDPSRSPVFQIALSRWARIPGRTRAGDLTHRACPRWTSARPSSTWTSTPSPGNGPVVRALVQAGAVRRGDDTPAAGATGGAAARDGGGPGPPGCLSCRC